ncbi:hypothetical protein KBZ21_38735, partial [Streptomyces sp. A73]|nr:hypothetical protein [Streptomyces sp. A73]
ELFRRMLSNRDAANPSRMTIRYRTHLDVVLRWCRQHGYRATAPHPCATGAPMSIDAPNPTCTSCSRTLWQDELTHQGCGVCLRR